MMRNAIDPDAPVNETTGMSDIEYAAEDIADGLEQQEFYDYYTRRKTTSFNLFASEFI